MNHLREIQNGLPPHVKLVAVSKTVPPGAILEVYNSGHRIFGENRAQELIEKQPLLPSDIKWHFIGHLQSNKVKYIAPFVSMIHSVDSLKLLREIDKEAGKCNRIIPCLLQFHIATEETKFGLNLQEARELLSGPERLAFKNVLLSGVMGMATFTDSEPIIRAEFKSLKEIFVTLKREFFQDDPAFREISMGMSGDYRIAVEEGSTIVRVGTAIFGSAEF